MPMLSKNPSLPDAYTLGDHQLPIQTSKRRKLIAVKIKHNALVLEVPHKVSNRQLKLVLDKNEQWLLNRVDELTQQLQKRFIGLDGDTFEFKGHLYQCVWQEDEKKPVLPKLTLNFCHLSKVLNCQFSPMHDQPKDAQLVCKHVVQNFIQLAEDYFTVKVDYFAKQMGLEFQSVTVKGYKSRWGSCYPDGRIQFNWRLMQAPEWVIDYVIVHELAHLVHANHSRDFWRLVEKHYPAMQNAKKVIKDNGRNWIGFCQT